MSPTAQEPQAAFLAQTAPGFGRRAWVLSRRRTPLLLVIPALATALVVNIPLVYLFLRAGEGGWDFYIATVISASTLRLVARTLWLVAGVVLLAAAIALPLAWLVTRTDLPGREIWALLGALPLAVPSYVAAFSLVAVLGPRGHLADWLRPLGIPDLPALAHGYSGALLALALFSYPYVYLPLVAALKGLDPALEESSRSLGIGRWGTFFRVILPQLRPSLYAGSLLVALYTLSDFGAVSIVGYDTFTVSIYNAYRSLLDRTVAASLSTVLVLVTVAFIALEAALARGLRATRRSPARPAPPVPLGRWRWPAVISVGLFLLLSLGIPAGVVVYWGVRGMVVGNPLGTAWQAALNSVAVSGGAAAVATLLAIPVATWAVRYPSWLSRGIERLAYAGYALPGIVVALALVFVATRRLLPLYQTLTLLMAAYVIRFLPQALAALRSALTALAPAFEEAARSLGRKGFHVLWTVTLPLVRPGLLAGAGLVFLTAMKELPATLILRPIGFETLATRIWSTAGEGIYSQASVPALWLLLASGFPVYLLIIRPALGGGR